MRLLLDENLSHKLPHMLEEAFPGTQHVRDLGLNRASDDAIWEFAKREGLIIVSKDADFHQRSLMFGHPPKIIGVFTGNGPTSTILRLLLDNQQLVLDFALDAEASFLSLILP